MKTETVPPCGLYCGVCRIYQATQSNDMRLLERLGRIYARRLGEAEHLTAADLVCDGCRSARRSWFCRSCGIRDCALARGYRGCHQCAGFPCDLIDNFPVSVGRRVMLRAIPEWRGLGTAAWVRAEENRYRCPACACALYRGARSCPLCGAEVDVD